MWDNWRLGPWKHQIRWVSLLQNVSTIWSLADTLESWPRCLLARSVKRAKKRVWLRPRHYFPKSLGKGLADVSVGFSLHPTDTASADTWLYRHCFSERQLLSFSLKLSLYILTLESRFSRIPATVLSTRKWCYIVHIDYGYAALIQTQVKPESEGSSIGVSKGPGAQQARIQPQQPEMYMWSRKSQHSSPTRHELSHLAMQEEGGAHRHLQPPAVRATL